MEQALEATVGFIVRRAQRRAITQSLRQHRKLKMSTSIAQVWV